MNNVMTNGFCELNENEMMMVDGGAFPWAEVAKGLISVATKHPYLTAIVVTGAAAYGCWCAGQEVGKAIGESIYNITH